MEKASKETADYGIKKNELKTVIEAYAEFFSVTEGIIYSYGENLRRLPGGVDICSELRISKSSSR